MLFTPEMEDVLSKVGHKVKKHYKQLKAELNHLDNFQKVDPQRLKEAYHTLESMKQIYVNSNMIGVYHVVLALVQMRLAEGLDEATMDKARIDFHSWVEKLPLFKDRNLWLSYTEKGTQY